MSNREIAGVMGISRLVVKNYLKEMYQQLGWSSVVSDKGSRTKLAVLFAQEYMKTDGNAVLTASKVFTVVMPFALSGSRISPDLGR